MCEYYKWWWWSPAKHLFVVTSTRLIIIIVLLSKFFFHSYSHRCWKIIILSDCELDVENGEKYGNVCVFASLVKSPFNVFFFVAHLFFRLVSKYHHLFDRMSLWFLFRFHYLHRMLLYVYFRLIHHSVRIWTSYTIVHRFEWWWKDNVSFLLIITLLYDLLTPRLFVGWFVFCFASFSNYNNDAAAVNAFIIIIHNHNNNDHYYKHFIIVSQINESMFIAFFLCRRKKRSN